MTSITHRKACSWAEIKERLDPAWSYVIIETTASSPGADVFRTVTALLEGYATDISQQEICRETSSGHLLILVKTEPAQLETLKRKLLDHALPSSVTIYFYDHTPGGDEP